MKIASLKEIVTFQRTDNIEESNWIDYLTTHAYINGVSGTEFFLANAGNEGSLTVTITCRYRKELMRITPMQYRIKFQGNIYSLLSPADDIQMKHKEVKFRARREYTEEDAVL